MRKILTIALLLLASCSVQTGGPSRFVEQTTGVLHVYADGTNGNDLYDGLSATHVTGLSGPKKTLQSAINLIPYYVKHTVAVHLVGTFDLANEPQAPAVFLDAGARDVNASIVIDGGPLTTVVAGPFTATANSTTTLTVAGAGWASESYDGYFVEILAGSAMGQTRTVTKTTTDTITVPVAWSPAPGNVSFQISRPTTTINHATYGYFNPFFRGNGYANLQRLSFTNKAIVTIGEGSWTISGVVSSSNFSHMGAFACTNKKGAVGGSSSSTSTGLSDINTELFMAGLGVTSSYVLAEEGKLSFYGSFAKGAYIIGSDNTVDRFGLNSRILGPVVLRNVRSRDYSWDTAGGNHIFLGGGTSISNPGGIGLLLQNSEVGMGTVDISGCGSHAISSTHSIIQMYATVTGTGNTGAGVYAYNGSVVNTTAGSPPTLTGNIGDTTVDGTTLASTWANIEAGVPVASVPEMTLIKKR